MNYWKFPYKSWTELDWSALIVIPTVFLHYRYTRPPILACAFAPSMTLCSGHVSPSATLGKTCLQSLRSYKDINRLSSNVLHCAGCFNIVFPILIFVAFCFLCPCFSKSHITHRTKTLASRFVNLCHCSVKRCTSNAPIHLGLSKNKMWK